MIRCSCCERRIDQSLAMCECVDGYCVACVLCDEHCRCRAARGSGSELLADEPDAIIGEPH